MRARYGEKLGRVRKLMHCNARVMIFSDVHVHLVWSSRGCLLYTLLHLHVMLTSWPRPFNEVSSPCVMICWYNVTTTKFKDVSKTSFIIYSHFTSRMWGSAWSPLISTLKWHCEVYLLCTSYVQNLNFCVISFSSSTQIGRNKLTCDLSR